MSETDYEALVERGDPDRWRTVAAAPEDKRAGLLALYGFNLEIARAPWVASEEMLAQIRLQWWTDAVEEIYAGNTPRRHEVVEPLARVIRDADLPKALVQEMIKARLVDAGVETLDDRSNVDRYVHRSYGHLMVLAASHLGASDEALLTVRDFAWGAGVAAFLRALPELENRQRNPLPSSVSIGDLAASGREAIRRARVKRGVVPDTAIAALAPGWLAEKRLSMAVAKPDAVMTEGLEVSEFRARVGLLWTVASGRW
ncbi:squalene/phytoene synthase family protein [Amaricoccus tamworthensis]|uniref:squalene/phytoene synthase family protein n=1 Tax=Amaricoccus tamworthensis TaxID=57002 RepID=UPI003C7AA668